MSRPCDLDAIEARKLIGNKKLSPIELTKSCIEQIERLNPSINAVVAIDNADVFKQAKKAEDGTVTALDVKKGDKILFGKWSGTEVTVDGDDLIIMKESDILGIIG